MDIRKTTEFFFLLTIFALPSYLIKFSLFSIPVNLLEILALFSLLLLAFWKKRALLSYWKKALLPLTPAFALLFLGLGASYLANAPALLGLGILKGWFFVPFFFALSVPFALPGRINTIRIIKTLFFSISLVSVLSLIHLATGNLTYDQRLAAFYLSPNHLAMYLAPAIPLAFYLLRIDKKLLFRCLFLCQLFLILISLYFTFSYAAWSASILSLFAVFVAQIKFFRKYPLIVTFVVIIFSLFFLLQYENPKLKTLLDSRSSLSSRLVIWQSGLKIAADNPLLGIGPGNFQREYLNYQSFYPPYPEWAVPQPHNLFLAFYLQTGLLGFIGFCLVCLYWLRAAWKQKNTAFSAVSVGILVYILSHGLVDTPYWKNDLAYLFWIVFFLAASYRTAQEKVQKSNL